MAETFLLPSVSSRSWLHLWHIHDGTHNYDVMRQLPTGLKSVILDLGPFTIHQLI